MGKSFSLINAFDILMIKCADILGKSFLSKRVFGAALQQRKGVHRGGCVVSQMPTLHGGLL